MPRFSRPGRTEKRTCVRYSSSPPPPPNARFARRARRGGAGARRGGSPPPFSGGADPVLDQRLLELEEVELHRLARRRLALGAHHELGDQRDQLLVLARQAASSDRRGASPSHSRARAAERRGQVLGRQPLEELAALRRRARCTSRAAPARGARARSAPRRLGRRSCARRPRRAAQRARRGRPPAAPPPPPDSTRRVTSPGSASSRSATRRTSSSRLIDSPIAASTGTTSSRARSRPAGELRSAASERRLDLEHRQVHRLLDQLREAAPAALAASSMSAGSSPCRHRRHPQPHLAARRRPAAPASSRPAPPGRRPSPAPTSSAWPDEQLQLLRGDRRPHHRDRLLDPRLVQREHVRVALDHDRPPRLRDRRPRAVDPEQRAALAVQLALGRVQVLRLRVRRPSPRAPKPSTRPRGSRTGNMIRARKRS